MPSFDVVSEADMHEVQNALNQANRELQQRYDFRGTGAEIKENEKGFTVSANSEDRVKASIEVFKEKFIKRKISLKFLDLKEPEAAGGQNWRAQIELKKGINKENGKKISQMVRDNKVLKLNASIQGDAVRVQGKKRDDLQSAMTFLKEAELPIEVSFENFRD